MGCRECGVRSSAGIGGRGRSIGLSESNEGNDILDTQVWTVHSLKIFSRRKRKQNDCTSPSDCDAGSVMAAVSST